LKHDWKERSDAVDQIPAMELRAMRLLMLTLLAFYASLTGESGGTLAAAADHCDIMPQWPTGFVALICDLCNRV
jgi:hypothetical protein